ncbi:MAG: formylglycine-generating enzyme family protein [Kiritimatiellae bacterium]|nr:formylglycine-generating enzyme family protein [Kiritimatiellia bacterium]
MKNLVTLAAAMLVTGALAYPQISEQRVVQDAQKRLEVSYALNEPAVVVADILVDGSPIPASHRSTFRGDVDQLVPAGRHAFTWKPYKEGFEGVRLDDVSVAIRAYSVSRPPDYMAVDIEPPCAVRYYESADRVPGGVTNDAYKTATMLFRLVPAANVEWVMGCTAYESGVDNAAIAAREVPHRVTLSEDYYIGVYPVTQGQYYWMTGERPSGFRNRTDRDLRPVENVAYQTLRGVSSAGWLGWPQEGHDVLEGSVLHAFRTRTGIQFDLPTDAQWEYAARAGARTIFYTGEATAESLMTIAWCAQNSYDEQGGQNETHAVGTKIPNAWGLYDVLGNVLEMCLDVHGNMTSAAAVDPVGPAAAANSPRLVRGGCYSSVASTSAASLHDCSLALRNICGYDSGSNDRGFRLVCPATAVK